VHYHFAFNHGQLYGNTQGKDAPAPFEEIFTEIGYTTAAEAVFKFEEHVKRELKLPLRVPPISFTHQFGRFDDFPFNLLVFENEVWQYILNIDKRKSGTTPEILV